MSLFAPHKERSWSWASGWCNYLFMAFRVPLPRELHREGVLLRALDDEDWRLEYDLSRVPDVPQWTYYPPNLDEVSARRRVTRTRERHEQGLAGRYAIVIDGTAVGTAGMAWIEGASPEVFYVLKPAGRGRGVATTSVRLLAEWLIAQGHLTVALETIAGNVASENVAQRAGFRCAEAYPGSQRGAPVQLNRWVRDAQPPSLTSEKSLGS